MALVDRAQAILLRPRETWPVVDQEQTTIADLYRGYVMPLAAIGPVAQVIASVLFAPSIAGFNVPRPSLPAAILTAVIAWLVALAFVYIFAVIIEQLAPTFGGTPDRLKAFKVAAYGGTASSLAQIFQLIPALGFLGLLGLYSFYLVYLGLPVLMKTPQERAIAYTVACVVVAIVVFIVLGIFVGIVAGILAGIASI